MFNFSKYLCKFFVYILLKIIWYLKFEIFQTLLFLPRDTFSPTIYNLIYPSTFINQIRCLNLNSPELVYIKTKTSRSTRQSISKTTWHALGKQLFSTDTRQRWSNQFVCQTQARPILKGLISRWQRWFSGSHCDHIEYCIRITVLVKLIL